MQQLTAEDKARVFAQYLGSKCSTPDGEGKLVQAPNIMFPNKVAVHFGAKMVKTINSVDEYKAIRNHGVYLIKSKVLTPFSGDVQDNIELPGGVQLILRPLSKISDEDAIEVYKMVRGVTSDDRLMIYKGRYYAKVALNTEATDFLRSRSYMLPYKGIDLFEAGIAIEQL